MKLNFYCLLHKKKTEEKPLKEKCIKEVGRKKKRNKKCKYLIVFDIPGEHDDKI